MFFKGVLTKEFEAHADIIRGIVEIPSIGFATCSNDELVKLWDITGNLLGEYKGHSGFVFGLCTLDSGEIVSGGDDCTVRVWRDGKCA